jgi:hypothetical protein
MTIRQFPKAGDHSEGNESRFENEIILVLQKGTQQGNGQMKRVGELRRRSETSAKALKNSLLPTIRIQRLLRVSTKRSIASFPLQTEKGTPDVL